MGHTNGYQSPKCAWFVCFLLCLVFSRPWIIPWEIEKTSWIWPISHPSSLFCGKSVHLFSLSILKCRTIPDEVYVTVNITTKQAMSCRLAKDGRALKDWRIVSQAMKSIHGLWASDQVISGSFSVRWLHWWRVEHLTACIPPLPVASPSQPISVQSSDQSCKVCEIISILQRTFSAS